MDCAWDTDTGKIYTNRILISRHTDDPLGTLLHEMIHQYQFAVLNDHESSDEDHGGIFRSYAKHLERRTRLKVR